MTSISIYDLHSFILESMKTARSLVLKIYNRPRIHNMIQRTTLIDPEFTAPGEAQRMMCATSLPGHVECASCRGMRYVGFGSCFA